MVDLAWPLTEYESSEEDTPSEAPPRQSAETRSGRASQRRHDAKAEAGNARQQRSKGETGNLLHLDLLKSAFAPNQCIIPRSEPICAQILEESWQFAHEPSLNQCKGFSI